MYDKPSGSFEPGRVYKVETPKSTENGVINEDAKTGGWFVTFNVKRYWFVSLVSEMMTAIVCTYAWVINVGLIVRLVFVNVMKLVGRPEGKC